MVTNSILRQSAAALLAYAVTELFPEVILVEGRVTEFGLYYDFIADQPIDSNAIPLIEEKVRGLVKENLTVHALDMMRENAAQLFEHKNQSVKAQFVLEARENIVQILRIEKFYDYCPPPYIVETGEINAFKILKIEPVKQYFAALGDDVNVIRIRAVAFPEKDRLKKHVKSVQQAKKVDHRRLGKEMNLFSPYEEASGCSWFWLPNGVAFQEVLLSLWQKMHKKQRFHFLKSPIFIKESLIKKSGLFDFTPEIINAPFTELDGLSYVVPPCLTPSHARMFQANLHSYKELPIRYAECAVVSSIGKDGSLWGLLNNRLTLSDFAHIFCSPVQLETELISSLQFIDKFIKMFDFEYHWNLGGRGQKFAGTLNQWKKAHDSFVNAFEKCGFTYSYHENESKFSGPFAEALLIDSIGREWKGPRISVDFNTPERFGLRYQGPDDEMHAPIMLVRSLFGSVERFTAVLVEHFAGQFPFWLAPEQVRVIPVLEKNVSYADEVCKAFDECGYRTSVDYRLEQLGSKIHSAENEMVPYLIIVGDKEEKDKLITVRSRGQKVVKTAVALEDFLALLRSESQPQGTPSKEIGSRLESQ